MTRITADAFFASGPRTLNANRWANWLDAPVDDAMTMAQPFPPERMAVLNE